MVKFKEIMAVTGRYGADSVVCIHVLEFQGRDPHLFRHHHIGLHVPSGWQKAQKFDTTGVPPGTQFVSVVFSCDGPPSLAPAMVDPLVAPSLQTPLWHQQREQAASRQ